ncbi:hypothetical protein [Streptomyces sp. NPDC059071]|uniref:hypothetical protein n=1 Tax=unclassified Streptomyces TaxID=2593676 RepID=UPI00364D1902
MTTRILALPPMGDPQPKDADSHDRSARSGRATAAAVVATVLIARAAVIHQGSRAHRPEPFTRRAAAATGPHRLHTRVPTTPFAPVREAERHVHRCWQHLRSRVDPPE